MKENEQQIDHNAPERLGMRDEIRRSLKLAKANLLKALDHLEARREAAEELMSLDEARARLKVMQALPLVEEILLDMRKRKLATPTVDLAALPSAGEGEGNGESNGENIPMATGPAPRVA